MPADTRHHYLNFPLDYGDSSSALFRGFYILSPHFQSDAPVVFFLTDGQMELVGPNPNADHLRIWRVSSGDGSCESSLLRGGADVIRIGGLALAGVSPCEYGRGRPHLD
jgi:hypothetical protein